MISIENVTLPDFGFELTPPPPLTVEIYRARLDKTVERMKQAGLDLLAVYGDREHSFNIAWLTGMDPRFEEALLLLNSGGEALLLVGNECLGYLPQESLGLKVELFQEFSLMGQPRGNSRPLGEIFRDFGLAGGTKVGCVGWKYYDSRLTADSRYASDLPSYIIDLLRDICSAENVTNATPLLTNPADGLRIVDIEPEQIARFEYAAVLTSTSTLNVMRQLAEGVREDELEHFLDGRGLPLSCHRMIRFGENARQGLASPTANQARLGDVFTIGYGIVGSLTSRAGFIARGPDDVPQDCRDFYARFAANYFDVVATWYDSIRLDAVAGDVYAAVQAKRDDSLYDFAVNPGHYIHMEEWVHSPFEQDSSIRLRSGMALQMDIIPVSKGPFVYSNAEDGVIIADDKLRSALASGYPACWSRIQARRKFMAEAIGIKLDESVLPMSNIPAWLPPYALSLDKVFVRR